MNIPTINFMSLYAYKLFRYKIEFIHMVYMIITFSCFNLSQQHMVYYILAPSEIALLQLCNMKQTNKIFDTTAERCSAQLIQCF